jgi:GNAT superfamily N-acetyltransferase
MIKRVKRKNPTDEEFLKKIKIVRNIKGKDEKYYDYTVYLQSEIIGKAIIFENDNFIQAVAINKEFQRRGISTYLYNYIEKDLNIKLRTSDYVMSDGKAFWENRLKRKNPTDLNFLKKVTIDKEIFKITDGKDRITSYQYNIYLNGKRIGYAEIVKGQNTVDDVQVLKPYQRKGLTTFLYDYIENDLKIKLKPSEYLDPDGKKFWESRLQSGKSRSL